VFIFSEEENESNEMKIISFRTTKKLNKDNIEETVILENQIEIHDYKHLGRLMTTNVPIGIMATLQTRVNEYVVAIEWLNKSGHNSSSCFLVRSKGELANRLKSAVGFKLN
jgi:hypothetical protein